MQVGRDDLRAPKIVSADIYDDGVGDVRPTPGADDDVVHKNRAAMKPPVELRLAEDVRPD